jgi:pilus assembly protein Flp/PilA
MDTVLSVQKAVVGSAAAMKKFAKDDRGATAIEYALIAGLIALAIIPAMSALGLSNNGMWNRVAANVAAATQ